MQTLANFIEEKVFILDHIVWIDRFMYPIRNILFDMIVANVPK